MTTPERLRARQRRESIAVAILAFALTGTTIYFAGQDSQQERCLSTFIASQTETSKIRSAIVERESQATRSIILGVFASKSREESIEVFEAYRKELRAIDKQREDNPIATFPAGICE